MLAFQRFNAKNFQKEVLYLELLTLSRVAIHQVVLALTKVKELSECSDIKLKWQAEVEHYRDLLLKVINQTEWRVINKEKIIFQKKIVSTFEEHMDIIVKGYRETLYGHKINLDSDGHEFITSLQ